MLESKNEFERQAWLKATLAALMPGLKILDAGAGELKNRRYCEHLEYISQDFCQYKGISGGGGMRRFAVNGMGYLTD
ncbi:MAG: hypothetical protein HQL77_02575 [Magnetococcales bacterium]|nr:hypothetical protein [Magnetococcales bacterium]